MHRVIAVRRSARRKRSAPGSGESSDVLALVVVGRVEHLRRHICKPEAEGQGKTGVGHPNCSVGHDWPLTLFPAHDPVHE
jgi:hypothetical protein